MLIKQNETTPRTIDATMLDRIVREVLQRLQHRPAEAAASDSSPCAVHRDAVITATTVAELEGNPTTLYVAPKAVITPAARDAARAKNLEIVRTSTGRTGPEDTPSHAPEAKSLTSAWVIDPTQPQRGEAVASQLDRRGIRPRGAARILLSDQPAKDVYDQSTSQGQRAAMVSRLGDVDRFAKELSPTLWVLDMARMNLTAATNVAARIANLG
jgi:hypothetical protein